VDKGDELRYDYGDNEVFQRKVSVMHVIMYFSSPEHKVLKVSFCDGPLSIVSVSSFNTFFKQLLFWNHLMDFYQTSQKRSLSGPLPKLIKPFHVADK